MDELENIKSEIMMYVDAADFTEAETILKFVIDLIGENSILYCG